MFDVSLLIALILWLAGVAGLGLHGYRAGLRTRLFHPVPLANLLGWPIALPVCGALSYWRIRTGQIA